MDYICVMHRSWRTSNRSKKQVRVRVNSIKALKIHRENGKNSNNCILMVDQMYLEKTTQYHGGEYVGADLKENSINP